MDEDGGMVNNAERRRGGGHEDAAATPPVLLLESTEAAETRRAFAAVERGSLADVQELVPASVGARAKNVFQSELIHVASARGHPDIVTYLLEHGADPDSLDYGGMRRTPLHWACWSAAGRASAGIPLRSVELLLAHGANPRLWGGPSWGTLNSSACGSRVSTESGSCTDDPSALAGDVHEQTLRLALGGVWSRQTHTSFPGAFRAATRHLLLVTKRMGFAWDDHLVDEVVSRMAFPLSTWVPDD